VVLEELLLVAPVALVVLLQLRRLRKKRKRRKRRSRTRTWVSVCSTKLSLGYGFQRW
jgi:membrane protein implicated in regulation of membrane protease activity